jgi:arylsulfatase A-like enzyme
MLGKIRDCRIALKLCKLQLMIPGFSPLTLVNPFRQGFWLLVISAVPCLAAAASTGPAKPNIVYVLADQWRASATGNAVSVAPVCTPYRAALMTGRYPTSTGMFLNDAHLPDSELCMAEIFRDAGYATAYIGKWHLDGHGRSSYIPPERRQGWDYWKAAECDHNYNHSHYYAGNSDVKQFWEGYDAFAETRDAEQYIRRRPHGAQPFILFIAYGVPHYPHTTAPAEFKALYAPEKIKLPPNVPPELQARLGGRARHGFAAFP